MSSEVSYLSRIAKKPLPIPKGVTCSLDGSEIKVKGTKGELKLKLHPAVQLNVNEDSVEFLSNKSVDASLSRAMSGTHAVLVSNMLHGVSVGFEKKLTLVGVGYRAKMQGNELDLSLGFSHPVKFPVPAGITIESPSPTEIVIKGADKQKVGQIAADIRDIRPPEPYKGKGVRYADEIVAQKQAKKK